jgi:hypothetical protein
VRRRAAHIHHCAVDASREEGNLVLSEYMMEKVDDLGSGAERQRKEDYEIRAKFDLIDKDGNGTLDSTGASPTTPGLLGQWRW